MIRLSAKCAAIDQAKATLEVGDPDSSVAEMKTRLEVLYREIRQLESTV